MKISIVIVTYNRLHALAELLESISRQTLKPFEIVIVNDAGESVQELIELYHELPIQLIELKENVKHVRARNIAVSKTSGDAIMLADDDDYFTTGHIERMAAALREYDFVYSDVEIVSFNTTDHTRIPTSRRLFAYNDDLEEMRRFSTYVPSGSLYKKEIHEQIGMFDPDIHNYWDWDFFLRVAKSFKIKRVPVASVIYAFSNTGNHQSSQLNEKRQHYLNKLSAKHQLGELSTKNFFVLLEEPEMKNREAESEVVWDGKPMHSRLVKRTFS
ncbi:glycosyltransferase family 2 protein [Metabacillus herbersteinensis]|uniref:Glycosyltransferase family 2 protein n=1 Tax=Metabacillus herbersteinensis TaxID=283816 RepID=A0ABV6GFE4_9BACI